MDWAMSGLTILTMWLAGSKSIWAWKIGLANQALWGAFIWRTGTWGLIPMWLAIIFTYSRNLYRWRTESTAPDKPEQGGGE